MKSILLTLSLFLMQISAYYDCNSKDVVCCHNEMEKKIPLISTPLSSFGCYGKYCCSQKRIIAMNIGCFDDSSCSYSQLTANADIQCLGNVSCINSNIISQDSLYCSGENSCKQSLIHAQNIIKCNGYQSCKDTKITNTPTVEATSDYSLSGAHIYSDPVLGILNITSTGLYSGDQSIIDCVLKTVCNINCDGNGCKGMIINCEIGIINKAECNVYCDGDNVACPVINDIEVMDENKIEIIGNVVIEKSKLNGNNDITKSKVHNKSSQTSLSVIVMILSGLVIIISGIWYFNKLVAEKKNLRMDPIQLIPLINHDIEV